jgi:hypothetical protein
MKERRRMVTGFLKILGEPRRGPSSAEFIPLERPVEVRLLIHSRWLQSV